MTHTATIPVFFATDDRYAPALGVALHSMLLHTDAALDIFVLINELTEENRALLTATVAGRSRLTFVDMRERIAPIADRLVLRDYYSATTYFRLFISELFPEFDKAIYLDCDIALHGDVAELYATPLGDCLVAAVPEDVMARIDVFGRYVEEVLAVPREEYFNAGVLVMNLAAFRRERILDRFVDMLAIKRYRVTQDEDYLNVLCYGRTVLLPYGWNMSPLADEGCRPLLAHYKLDRKPWHYEGVHFGEDFWHYADETPYAEALHAGLAAYSEADRAHDREGYASLVALAEEEMATEKIHPTDPRAKAHAMTGGVV